jgi:hypothetical protein
MAASAIVPASSKHALTTINAGAFDGLDVADADKSTAATRCTAGAMTWCCTNSTTTPCTIFALHRAP